MHTVSCVVYELVPHARLSYCTGQTLSPQVMSIARLFPTPSCYWVPQGVELRRDRPRMAPAMGTGPVLSAM